MLKLIKSNFNSIYSKGFCTWTVVGTSCIIKTWILREDIYEMDYSTIIPQEVSTEAAKFFGPNMVAKAQTLLNKAQLSISFQKGSPERFFIISGIVNDGNTSKSKVTYRNNEDGKSVTSNCDCNHWDPNHHCEHSCALFARFIMNYQQQTHSSFQNLEGEAISIYGQGVHARNYGHIIHAPTKLNGARVNSTYSSLQYMLTSRKVINFPLPVNLDKIVRVDFVKSTKIEEYKNFPNAGNQYYPVFSLIKEDHVENKISIFESLYIFDWTDGSAYHLPPVLADFTKKYLREGLLQPINLYLQDIQDHFDDSQIQICIEGKPISETSFEEVNFRLSVNQGDRKNYLELKLEGYDSQSHLIRLPEAFKILASDNGYLSFFRTKIDSYNFIRVLKDSFEGEGTEYKKYIHSCSKKKDIIDWLKVINTRDSLYFMDPHHDKIYLVKSGHIKSIIPALVESFSDMFARFSRYDDVNKNVQFQIPRNQLLSGISNLYHRVSSLGISVFYNNSEVKTWSSNIRFERRKSNLDWFELDLIINQKDLDIIRNTDLGENYLLSGDQLVLLDTQEKELLKFMKKYTNFEATGQNSMDEKAAKKFSLNFKRARIFELFELKKYGISGALTPEEEQLCNNLINLKEMPKYPLPERYQNLAREYQVTGYQWLRFLFENKFGACLADDMGLGKTLQTIMFVQSIIKQVDKVLIVCPVSILINWQNEISKFADFDVEVYYGGQRELNKDAKVILTSYGVMKKESYTTFNDMYFDVLIMDEVQHLKNIRSQGASSARNLNANFRVCLTGTPVENDLSEFYNILDLCIPGIWGELNFIKTTSTKKSRLLARKTVRPFILRRTKEQVLTELPEKVENHVYLNFNEDERENYIRTLAQIRDKIGTVQTGRKYGEILKSLLKLRQLCLWQKSQSIQSTKVEFLQEYLEQILEENHKAIVFSQFTTYLDIIENKVREQGWKYARIDGSQTFKKRAQEVERFQNGDAQVFLISLKAGGVGLNLTAASYIFLMDPWWNPAVENQAIDRAHRIGQENKLTVYRPIIKDSVEEKVLVLQNTKKELFNDLMAEDDESFYSGKLTMDDFQELLS